MRFLRPRPGFAAWWLVATLVTALLFPLHVHEEGGEHRGDAAECAWTAGGERVVFGESHADHGDHLCPLGHSGALTHRLAAATASTPSLPFLRAPDTRDAFRIRSLPSCRGPPAPSIDRT